MLHFVLKFHQLLRKWKTSNRRHIVDNMILVGICSKNAIGTCSAVLQILREAQKPLKSILFAFIFDLDESLDGYNYWFDLITLTYFAGLGQY